MTSSEGWKIEFYVDARGHCPVIAYLDGLSEKEQAEARGHLKLLQEFGLELGMPHARGLKGHKPLWELRPFPNRLIYFACTGRRFIILHAFRKTSQKTPSREIEVAERRMKEFLERTEP